MVTGLPQPLDGRESACSAGDLVSIPGSGRSPGEENVPLQYSCLGNTEKPGRLQVYSVAKSQTQLKQLSTPT